MTTNLATTNLVGRCTRWVLRHRWPVAIVWLAILVAGFWASGRLSDLQSNVFSVPGTDSERVRTVLEQQFGDRSDGAFTVVFRVANSADPQTVFRLQALVHPAGARAYVTGAPAIQHDLDPIFNHDLQKGEAIALPIALLVLLAVFGLSLAVTIPFLFAACTVFGTLGIVYVAAHYMTTPTYVTNLVFLIGIGIAIDYSLLIVYRFREELGRGLEVEEAVLRTMETAGRAVIVSGFTVAIGLALLLFMPLPFMRAMGVGGFLIPIVSILAAATLQPALLAIYGRRGTHRAHVANWLRLPVRQVGDDVEHRFWARLARSIMRHKWWYVAGIAAVLVAGAIPVVWLQLTPGATAGIPQYPQSVQGLKVLEGAVGPGSIAPAQVLVDGGRPGGARSPEVEAAITRLVGELGRDPEVAAAYHADTGRFVDRTGRWAQVIVATRHEYGSEEAQDFARRLRSELIPAA